MKGQEFKEDISSVSFTSACEVGSTLVKLLIVIEIYLLELIKGIIIWLFKILYSDWFTSGP